MFFDPPPGPAGHFNVSAMPTFLRDSSRAGWEGAFFTSLVSAPEGAVDHLHRCYCLIRTQQPLEIRPATRVSWDILPAGIGLWRPGDEQRGSWRRGVRSQFLFVDPGRVDSILEGDAGRLADAGGAADQSPVAGLIFDALEADLAQSSPAGPLVGDSLLTALIAQVSHAKVPTGGRLQATTRKRVIEYVEAHLERPITLAELADVAGVGLRHLNRLFRASTGESPHSYILRRRIERAKTLIGLGVPLAEAALQCGFAGQSQFTRTFLRVAGVTPGRFRADARR